MFANLFSLTTNPLLSWKEFFTLHIWTMIITSVVFHTIIYVLFCNIISYVFYGKILSNAINIRLIVVLSLIMLFGYIGRFIHVKDVFNDFNKDDEKTNYFVQQHYNSWIFIG